MDRFAPRTHSGDIDVADAGDDAWKQSLLDYTYNLAKARQLLKEWGHPDGFTLTMTTPSPATQAEILQAQLKKIGINLKLKTVDTNTWQQASMEGKQPIDVTLIAFRGTPQEAYTSFFYGPSAVVGGSHPAQNFSLYTGADKLIEQASVEADPQKQQQLWTAINDKILSDAVVKPLMVSNQSYASVCGFTWGGAEPLVKIPGNWQATWKATIDSNDKSC